MSKYKIHRYNFSIGKPYGTYSKIQSASQEGAYYIKGIFYTWNYTVLVYAEEGYASFRILDNGRIYTKSISGLKGLPTNVWLSRQANTFLTELLKGE